MPNSRIPKNWETFLHDDNNKTELFAYLAEQITNIDCTPKEMISTYGKEVRSSSQQDFSNISPCSHEEADTRILLHAANCCKVGHKKIKNRGH